MTNQLKQLSEAATQGEWFVLDTKHLSTRTERIFDDRMGEPANAKLVTKLVNAYRAGELVPASELEEALAREAVAYEVAAKYHDEIFKHDSAGIEYSSLVGIPISNLGELETSCRRAEIDAKAIRALTPDHTTTALEQIKQQARDEGKREAFHEAAYAIEKRAEEIVQNHLPVSAFNELRDAANSIRSILATLSADTQENSDG